MKKRLLRTALLSAAVMFSTAAVAQQEYDTETRLLKLEKIVAGLPRISGFVNLRYQYEDANGTSNGFDVRRARLDLQGDISPKFDYRLQVEFAGSPKILDAYFRWKPARFFNFQAGEFKIPFSLENAYGPHQLETIDNSMVITGLSGYTDVSGISANGRDVGLMAYGGLFAERGFSLIDYGVGIFNGNGINTRDNNNSKDFSGRININPVRHFALSVSHYNGSTGRKGEAYRRVRTGGGVKYDDKKLLVRGEYLYGRTADFKTDGFYVVGAYFAHAKWQPLLKYDWYRRDRLADDGKRINYIAGLNYFPVKNVRLQLNYTYKTITGDSNSNCVAVQVFGVF